MNRISVQILKCFVVFWLLALCLIPVSAMQGIGTVNFLSASITKVTLQDFSQPGFQPDSLNVAGPVGGSDVNVCLQVKHGTQVTVTSVLLTIHEKDKTSPTQDIVLTENTTLSVEPTGEGDSLVTIKYYTGKWDTSSLFNNKYVEKAKVFYRKSGMTTYCYETTDEETEVKNLIIDIDELANNDQDVIYVPETGLPSPFLLKMDDAVESQTTITFKLYPTDRNANTEPICIPVSSEQIPFFGFPFEANVTWLDLDNLENRVPSGTYVYTVSVSQPDGDKDSSVSDTLTICDTFAGDSDVPDKMTMLYTMVDTTGEDATEAKVRVYDSLGFKVVDDTAGTQTCWLSENAIDGWNYSELPIPEATEYAYGAFRCVVRAKDAGAATEKAHRNKWALGKNTMLGTYKQACYYDTDLSGAEECATNVVNKSKSWLVGPAIWVPNRNRWIRNYYASQQVGDGTDGPYADKSEGTIKSVIDTLGNIQNNFRNLFYFYGHGNASFITCGAGEQLTATELSVLATDVCPLPLANIRLAVLVSCRSVNGITSIGYQFKQLGAQNVIGSKIELPNGFSKLWSPKFIELAMKGKWLDPAHADVTDPDAAWQMEDLDIAMQNAELKADEEYEKDLDKDSEYINAKNDFQYVMFKY